MADSESVAKAIEGMNWEKTEEDEFMKVLSQSLLIQTPLQVLLEMMFKRMATQSKTMEELKDKVEVMEKSSLNTTAVLQRLQAVEDNTKNLLSSKLSPFAQVEMLERIDRAEFAAERALRKVGEVIDDKNLEQIEFEGHQSSMIEKQLSGIDNIPGKLMAVDEMADELGIAIPNIEYDDQKERLKTPEVKSSRIGKLQKTVVLTSHEVNELTKQIKALQQSCNNLSEELVVSQRRSTERLTEMEEKQKDARRKMTEDIQAVKRSVLPAEGTSYSDFAKLASDIGSLQMDAKWRGTQLDDMKTRDIARLQEAVCSLRDHALQQSEMLKAGSLVTASVKNIEKDMIMMKKRIQNAISAALAGGDKDSLAGVARQSDVQEIAEQLANKVTREDVLKLVTRAIEHIHIPQSSGDSKFGGRALKFRCLSCDREVVTRRPEPLGSLPSCQGFIPKFESIPGRESGTPAGPGLNAAELRKLQNLAAERMELRENSPNPSQSISASPMLDHRPNTANPPGFLGTKNEQSGSQLHEYGAQVFPGPFQTQATAKTNRVSKPPVFVH